MFSKFFGHNMPGSSTATVKAWQYNVEAYESIGDANHGDGIIITEIFIPEHSICFNSEGYVFPSENPRNIVKNIFSGKTTVNEITEIKLSKELVDKILSIENLEARVKKEKEELKSMSDYQELFEHKPKQKNVGLAC